MEPEQEESWYRGALERYERSRAAAQEELESGDTANSHAALVLSSTEAKQIRQLYLMDCLGKYSAPVKSEDIHVRSGEDVESSGYRHHSFIAINDDDDDDHNNKDDCSTNSSDNDEGTLYIDFSLVQTSDTYVRVKCAGQSIDDHGNDDDQHSSRRDVPNGCAICLSEFDAGHRITWASNPECPHCYHEDCILNWMMTVGNKKRPQNRLLLDQQQEDPVHAAISFPKLCPCCRRPFIASTTSDTLQQNTTSMEQGASRRNVMTTDQDSMTPTTSTASLPSQSNAANSVDEDGSFHDADTP